MVLGAVIRLHTTLVLPSFLVPNLIHFQTKMEQRLFDSKKLKSEGNFKASHVGKIQKLSVEAQKVSKEKNAESPEVSK
jgi:glutaredoxin 2